MWEKIRTAPFGRDLQLAVIEEADRNIHALVFPCRREPDGWVNSLTGQRVPVSPTHWRTWQQQARPVLTGSADFS